MGMADVTAGNRVLSAHFANLRHIDHSNFYVLPAQPGPKTTALAL
jgi:hypothetical protein